MTIKQTNSGVRMCFLEIQETISHCSFISAAIVNSIYQNQNCLSSALNVSCFSLIAVLSFCQNEFLFLFFSPFLETLWFLEVTLPNLSS